MQNQNESFEPRQEGTPLSINQDAQQNDGPDQQHALVRLRGIVRMRERYQSLKELGRQEGSPATEPLPTGHGQPALDVAEQPLRVGGSHHGHPVVLTPRHGSHRGQFGQGGENGQAAQPDENEAIHDARGTSVLEPDVEQDGGGFPADEGGAAEAEDGEEAKVALQDGVLADAIEHRTVVGGRLESIGEGVLGRVVLPWTFPQTIELIHARHWVERLKLEAPKRRSKHRKGEEHRYSQTGRENRVTWREEWSRNGPW